VQSFGLNFGLLKKITGLQTNKTDILGTECSETCLQESKIQRDVLNTRERRVFEMNLLVWSAVCHCLILVLCNIALCGGQLNLFASLEGTL